MAIESNLKSMIRTIRVAVAEAEPAYATSSHGSIWIFRSPTAQHGTILGSLAGVYYGFRYIGATIQKERGRRTIMTFDIEPTLGLNVSSIVECKAEVNKDIRIGQLRTNLKALVAGVPVVFPVTFYLYFEAAAAGSITFESTLTHEFSSAFTISNSSGQWRSSRRNGDGNNGDESPWGIQKSTWTAQYPPDSEPE